MADPSALDEWIESLIIGFFDSQLNIDIGAVEPQIPDVLEFNLFNSPIRAHRDNYYSAVASLDDGFIFHDNTSLDAIDFEYEQGFDVINGVSRSFYVAQLGNYNLENFGAVGQEPIVMQTLNQSSIFNFYLINFRFRTTQSALMDAYIELNDPKSDRKIYFVATDILFNPSGIENTARMELSLIHI